MDLNDKQALVQQFKRQYVNVEKFSSIFEILEETAFFIGSESTGIFVGGEAGVGKSTLAEKFKSDLNVTPTAEHDYKPVVIASFRSEKGVGGILESILYAMGDVNPSRHKGTTSKLNRIDQLIVGLGVRYIFLDEFHNALPGNGLTNQSQALKLLKDLTNLKKVVVVVLGLPEAKKMISFKEEVDQRFENCLLIEPFDCNNNENTLEFIEYLYTLLNKFPLKVDYLACVQGSINNDQIELRQDVDYTPLYRFLLATKGIPRNIYKLLSYCILKANNSGIVNKQLLADGWERRINKFKGKENPFRLTEKKLFKSLKEEGLHG